MHVGAQTESTCVIVMSGDVGLRMWRGVQARARWLLYHHSGQEVPLCVQLHMVSLLLACQGFSIAAHPRHTAALRRGAAAAAPRLNTWT